MIFSADSPIISSGASVGTPEQCSRFILAHPHGEYNAHDVASVIVPAYFAACAAVGLAPVMLLAQMIHETGNLGSWWSQRPRRNPAGIGVTGRRSRVQPSNGTWQHNDSVWLEGVAFDSWDNAIPAHCGRILAYARSNDRTTAPQREMIDRAMAYRPLPASYRGVAPTWRGLNGRWAVPGLIYADKIATLATAMLRA